MADPRKKWKASPDDIGQIYGGLHSNGITSYEACVFEIVYSDEHTGEWGWEIAHVRDDSVREFVTEGYCATELAAKKAVLAWAPEPPPVAPSIAATLHFVGEDPENALSCFSDSSDEAMDVAAYYNRRSPARPWKVYAVEVTITPDMLVEDG